MDNTHTEVPLQKEPLTIPTYRMITTKRLLSRYTITLTDEQIEYTLGSPQTFYPRLLRIPLKNIFNGIILQQAKDYQLYLQKLLIDYLLSKDAHTEGEEGEVVSRGPDSLEEARLELLSYNEQFNELELEQQRLIGYSQAALLKHAVDWKEQVRVQAQNMSGQFSQYLSEAIVLKVLNELLVFVPMEGATLSLQDTAWQHIEKHIAIALEPEDRQVFLNASQALVRFALDSEIKLTDFWDKTRAMTEKLRNFRSYFQNLILKVIDYLKQSDYRIDEAKNRKNREALYFDASLGD